MTKWISTNKGGGVNVYHTTKDCPHFPQDKREVTEDDIRRGIRECNKCQNIRMHKVLEGL